MKVLVIGGTGGFGTSICRMLRDDGHQVTAAGRNESRGEAFAADNTGIAFVRLDHADITVEQLHHYDIVVDAAGPFRDQDHRLARAAIAASVDCIDIADDRGFVTGTASLNDEAVAAGVRILSGASSVPTLSGAIALELAPDMEEVELVEIAISASSRAAFGRSVLHSMLSGAGRMIKRSDGTTGVGMTSPRRLVIRHAGQAPMIRSAVEVDVPDQDVLPTLLPGNPSIRFHAGSELPIHNISITTVSWFVRKGLLRSGIQMLGVARLARHLTSGIGDGRSAMEVRVTGSANGRRLTRTWSLIAERNLGPLIPCLAVPALITAIGAGRIRPGAGTSAGMLSTNEILSRMPPAAITTQIVEEPASIYERSMPGYDRLPPAVRHMHDLRLPGRASGRAKVTRSTSPAARLIARIFGFPPTADDMPVTVTFDRTEHGERWTRDFGGSRFSSELSAADGGVVERFGPLRFRFRLDEASGRLRMIPVSWSFLGVPMPRWLMMDGIATEREEDGKFVFDVPISLPVIGDIVHYQGWLIPEGEADQLFSTRESGG